MVVSFVLAVVMLAAVAGCGPKTTPTTAPTTAPVVTEAPVFSLTEYTLGSLFPNAGAAYLEQAGGLLDQLASLSEGTTLFASTFPVSIDQELTTVQDMIAGGAKAIVVIPFADSALPAISQICNQSGVYWAISMRAITDPEVKQLVEADPYYAGATYFDEYTTGYQLGKMTAEQGFTKLAMLSTIKGDTTGDLREQGLRQACTEFGCEIVAEVRGLTQPAEVAQAGESFMAAYPDLDAIVAVFAGNIGGLDALVGAVAASGNEVKVASVDSPYDPAAFFDSGVGLFYIASYMPLYDFTLANIKAVNALQGTPILNAEGKPSDTVLHAKWVTTKEVGLSISAFSLNPDFLYYSDEYIENNLFKWNNAALDETRLQEIADAYDPFTMSPTLLGQ